MELQTLKFSLSVSAGDLEFRSCYYSFAQMQIYAIVMQPEMEVCNLFIFVPTLVFTNVFGHGIQVFIGVL